MVQAQILQLLVAPDPRLRARADPGHPRPAGGRPGVRPRGGHVRRRDRRDGRPTTLYHDPRHPYTRLLFAATPDLLGDDDVLSIPGTPPRLDHELVGCPFQPRCDRPSSPARPCSRGGSSWAPGHEAACHLNDPTARGGVVSDSGGARCSRSRTWSPASRCRAGSSARCAGRRSCGARRRRRHVLAWRRARCSRWSASPAAARRRPRRRAAARRARRRARSASTARTLGPRAAARMRPLRQDIQIIYQDPYESLDPALLGARHDRGAAADPRRRPSGDGARGAGPRGSWSGPA